MSTRGVHKKRKKSSRSFFDRRKNDERKRQATESTLTLPVSSPFTISHLAEIPINKQWRVFKRTESVDFCKLEEHSNGRHHVTINLTISSRIYLGPLHTIGKQIPTACDVLDEVSSSSN